MKMIGRVAQMQAWSRKRIGEGASIGLVPTMGSLHEGHVSLVRRSAAENRFTVVSIFVNPAQFGPREDYAEYPRSFRSDLRLLRREKADIVFAPPVHEMYRSDFSTFVEEKDLSRGLCGRARPGHFCGVTTIVSKLFLSVTPHNAYFGEKDYQQLKIIQKMVKDLGFPIAVVACPIVRESDGLALSSRNKYLSRKERVKAVLVYNSLQKASEMLKSGRRSKNIFNTINRQWQETKGCRLEYMEFVDPETLAVKHNGFGRTRILIAGTIGSTRLIDTIEIRRKKP